MAAKRKPPEPAKSDNKRVYSWVRLDPDEDAMMTEAEAIAEAKDVAERDGESVAVVRVVKRVKITSASVVEDVE